jgi:hypothetical protein
MYLLIDYIIINHIIALYVFLGLVLKTQLRLYLLQDLGDIIFNLLVDIQSTVIIDILAAAMGTVLLMEHHV